MCSCLETFTFITDNNYYDIEKEVIRIIEGMPNWEPGKNKEGESVLTKINFVFTLEFKEANPFSNF